MNKVVLGKIKLLPEESTERKNRKINHVGTAATLVCEKTQTKLR